MPIYDCPFDLRKNNRMIFRIAVIWLRCSCILGISLCSSKQRLRRSLYILYFPLLPLVLNYIQLLFLLVIVNGTMSNMVLVFILFSTDVCNSFPRHTPPHNRICIEMHISDIYKYIHLIFHRYYYTVYPAAKVVVKISVKFDMSVRWIASFQSFKFRTHNHTFTLHIPIW